MRKALWFVRTDLCRRPLRVALIVLMTGMAVVVLSTMLMISSAGFVFIQKYLNLFKPNMILVMGPILPVSPSAVAKIPHVARVVELLVTDAYINCTGKLYYIMLIGYPNMTSLKELVTVKILKGNPSGLMVPPSLSFLYGRQCYIVLPFIGNQKVNVTGIASSPVLESVLGKSKVAFIKLSSVPQAPPNALAVLTDSPKYVDYVVNKIQQLSGGQAYIVSQKILLRFDQLIRSTMDVVTAFVGTLTLVIASIAVSVIMLMDIRSRAWEIGLLKALGYTSSELASIYLVQAVIYATLALLFGLPVSYYLLEQAKAAFAESYAKFGLAQIVQSMALTPTSIATAVGLTYGTMIISVMIPVLAVYKLDPIQALRSVLE